MLFRTEVNMVTGEVTRVEQTLFGNASGETQLLDKGSPAPQGFIECGTPPKGLVWDGSGFSAPPTPVPQQVTRRQGRRALLESGYLQTVEGYIATIRDETERMQAQIEYEADTWERSNPWVGHMLELLGLTAQQGDDLFRLAVTF